METKNIIPQGAAAATDTTASVEAVMTQLRAVQQQIPDVTPLTAQERRALRVHARTPGNVINASLSVIGASDIVQQAVGHPADVQRWVADANSWTVVENQLRVMLKGIEDANLIRRQRAGLASTRAYLIGQQIVRDPENADLIPHLEEVKRQKALTRRRKAQATSPEPPAPSPVTPHAGS